MKSMYDKLWWGARLSGLCMVIQANQKILLDEVVARVGPHPILEHELQLVHNMESNLAAQGSIPAPTLEEVLRKMITMKVLLENAQEEKIAVSELEIDQQLQPYILQAGSKKKFLQGIGVPLDEVKKMLTEQAVERHMREKITAPVEVSTQEVCNYLEYLKTQQVLSPVPEKYFVRQICMPTATSAEYKNQLNEKLRLLKEQILAGADFEVVAKEHAEEESIAQQGGNLGHWKWGQLEEKYEQAVMQLEVGEISDPIELRAGMAIVKVLAKDDQGYASCRIFLHKTRHLEELVAVEEALAQIKDQLLRKEITFSALQEQLLKEGRGKAFIFSVYGKGAWLEINDFPKREKAALAALNTGEFTPPLPHKMGQQSGLRLLWLVEKRPAHLPTLVRDYDYLRQKALQTKQAQHLATWVKNALQKTPVQLSPTYAHIKL